VLICPFHEIIFTTKVPKCSLWVQKCTFWKGTAPVTAFVPFFQRVYCSTNLLYMGATDSSYWVKGTSLAASSRRRPVITSRRKEIQAVPIDQPYDVYTWAICSRPIRLSVSSRAFWEYLMYKLTPERVRRPEKTHAQARINAHAHKQNQLSILI